MASHLRANRIHWLGFQFNIQWPDSLRYAIFNGYVPPTDENMKYESMKTTLKEIVNQTEMMKNIRKALWYTAQILNEEASEFTSNSYFRGPR